MKLFLALIFLLSCSGKTTIDISKKWDYDTKRWFEGKGNTKEFTVLLKDEECLNRLKKKYKIVSYSSTKVIVIKLNKKELEELSKEDCVSYISFPKPVHLKFN